MQIPSEVVLWKFGGTGSELKSENNYVNNKGYTLHCSANNQYLIWEKGKLSVNLDFDANPQPKYHIHLPDGKERTILTGETIALAIGGGEAYLYYGEQTVGINLKWSKAPKHEWKIIGADGKKGIPVKIGGTYALHNQNVKPDPDFLIYLNRHMPKVVRLGWTSSPEFIKDLVNKAAKEIAKKAAQALVG